MEADRWRRINDAFFSTFMLDAERRADLLQKLGADDPAMMDEVSSLLAAHEAAGDFIQSPVISANHLLDSIADRLIEGRRFGPYRVVRKIDHGGMGVVYLAERADNAFQKLVAIKVIRTGLDSPGNLRRFYKERQILAQLEHPNIARLLDGGDTEEGLPYLVMEYIAGRPIDAYCDEQRLSVAERLRLFRRVCSAVEYAHQNGVIHHDIKPSNILVTEGAEPKLVDFGIAKLLSHPSAAPATIDTRRMTPEYTSPEEVSGQAVNRATDIYSLGIVLYELLTGQRPFDFRNRTPHEILCAICEQTPEKPSARIGTAAAKRIGELRRSEPENLRQLLAGTLDNIVLKAIRKEPSHRYPSAEHLAEDIDRHLSAQRVTAGRETAAHRTGRFLGRNLAGMIVTSLLLATLAGGIGVMRTYRRLAQWRAVEAQGFSKEAGRQIFEATKRAQMAEADLNQLRKTTELEEESRKADTLKRLNQILDARRTSRGSVVNTSEVVFEAGRTNLSPGARERLARIAGALLECSNMYVRVEGYSDNYGDPAYNLALSEERARVVQAYLVAQGLRRSTIVSTGLGAIKPIASNSTDFGRRMNRRVNIVLYDAFSTARSHIAGGRRPRFTASSLNYRLANIEKPPGSRGEKNLALNKMAIGSPPCNPQEGPEKAFNGSVSGGNLDKWCSEAVPAFLQVDLGSTVELGSFIVKHASAGSEARDFNTRDFEIQISPNGTDFTTVVAVTGNAQGVTRHAIAPTPARFVRMNISVPGQSAPIKASRIYELEVYPPAGLHHIDDNNEDTEEPPSRVFSAISPPLQTFWGPDRDIWDNRPLIQSWELPFSDEQP